MSRRGRKRTFPQPTMLPTPERVAKAGEMFRLGEAVGSRIDDDPLSVFHARRLLTDETGDERPLSALMAEAGRRFRRDWYLSGLAGPGSINYASSGGGDGDPAWGMPTSERAMSHRTLWRRAYRAMTDEQARVVGGIVLDERSTLDVGREVASTRDRTLATAFAMVALRTGLKALVEHYGLIAQSRDRGRVLVVRYTA